MTMQPLTEHEADLLREAVVAELRDTAEALTHSLGCDPLPPASELKSAADHVKRMGELVELFETRIGFESTPGGGPLIEAVA